MSGTQIDLGNDSGPEHDPELGDGFESAEPTTFDLSGLVESPPVPFIEHPFPVDGEELPDQMEPSAAVEEEMTDTYVANASMRQRPNRDLTLPYFSSPTAGSHLGLSVSAPAPLPENNAPSTGATLVFSQRNGGTDSVGPGLAVDITTSHTGVPVFVPLAELTDDPEGGGVPATHHRGWRDRCPIM